MKEEEKLIWPPSLSHSLCLKGYIKMSKIVIKNKIKKKNSSFFILTYLARGKYIVDSIKTEPDRRIYQQVLSSPRLKYKLKIKNYIEMYTKREHSVITILLVYMFAYTAVSFASPFSLENRRSRACIHEYSTTNNHTFLFHMNEEE